MVADRSFYEAIPGLHDVLTPALQKDVAALRPAEWKTTVAGLRAALHGWTLDRDQVRLAVAPTIPHHCSDEFIRACVDLAKEYSVGMHTHVAESKVQAIVGLQRYGKTLTAHLDDLGVVSPHFTVAHGVWLDDDDMKRLGDRGASVSHNPGSNLRLGNGLADMRAMLERRVNVAIGTDGANCSDNLNMYESMRLASLVIQGPWTRRRALGHDGRGRGGRHRGQCAGARLRGPARTAGARLQGRHRVPRPRAPELDPAERSINQLVHTEDGGAVRHVMIGGRLVVEDRRVTTVDVAALAREAEAARRRLTEIAAPAKALYERLAPIVGRFCPGLAHVPYHVSRYVGGA
jgi:guanine deaminase